MSEFKPNKPGPLSETSDQSPLTKGDDKKELVDEHKRLVRVLESPSHEDDKDEAKIQAKELKEMKADMEKSEGMQSLAKALKALAVLGLSRRARMDVAYKLGVAEGTKSPAVPFATEDLSQTPTDIGITKEQLRPSYEPPVVPVRRVETPGHIAPKPCGDHEYKTPDTSTTPAKPFWRR